jgi:hypothetical protein
LWVTKTNIWNGKRIRGADYLAGPPPVKLQGRPADGMVGV